jgi:hypothetical protein
MTPAPLVTAIAIDLGRMFREVDARTRHELRGIASGAAALETFGAHIRLNGCTTDQAREFARIHNRLRRDLEELAEFGFATTGTLAQYILDHADELAAATLALMPALGTA